MFRSCAPRRRIWSGWMGSQLGREWLEEGSKRGKGGEERGGRGEGRERGREGEGRERGGGGGRRGREAGREEEGREGGKRGYQLSAIY